MKLAIAPKPYRSPEDTACRPLRDRFAPYVEAATVSLLDPAAIESLAEDMGVVQRHRKHHSGLLVCAMILAAFQGAPETEGRWLDTAANYRSMGGAKSGMTSIRKMGCKMLPVMQRMVRRRINKLADAASSLELEGRLRAFRDILVPDGCGFKLASILSGISPGTGQPAELKLHAVYSVKAATAISVTPTAGSVHDSDGFSPKWEAGALYIWDLGYQSVDRFVDGALAGAQLLQRLKDNHNPVIVASYGPSGARRAITNDEGGAVRLEDALSLGLVHKSEQLDMDVELRDTKKRTIVARVVCVPTEGEDRYYLTTLPRAIFSPSDVAELYRLRWEVELFFKNWKSGVRMDHVHRLRNPTALAVSVTASMLAALLSRELHQGLDEIDWELQRELDTSAPVEGVSPCGSRKTAAA